MKQFSLSARLMIAAGITATCAVTVTWFVISKLFEQIYEERLIAALSLELEQLTDLLRVDDQGDITVDTMLDQRYSEVFSGVYWQVERPGEVSLVSRSLWDQNLNLPFIEIAGEKRALHIELQEEDILALSWTIDINGEFFPKGLMLTVATDLKEIRSAASQFQNNITLWMALMTVALVLAAWFQVRIGLRPLETVRTEIGKLRKNHRSRLPRSFPNEVVPLVDEVNQLLDSQEQSIESARNRAANLAHGLKTPLTVIEALAEETDDDPQGDAAKQIQEQVRALNAFVERELAKSKHKSSHLNNTDVASIARRVVAAIGKLPADRPITWGVKVPEGLTIPMSEDDLTEILGNLLDNARKYAASHVIVSAAKETESTWLAVADDGPGVPEEKLGLVLKRGERISGNLQGYGLGLSITEELVRANDCELKIENGRLGGLSVTVSWAKTDEREQ